MVFVAENYIDFQSWRKALESYVVQTVEVQKVYKMSDQLGKGSHAQVFLATPLYSIQVP